MNHKNTTIFEVSWEVCNKVGGIYTVLSSKAKSMSEAYQEVIMIGPDLAREDSDNQDFIEDKTLFEAWRMQAAKQGLKVRVGRWNIPGNPIVFLVDFTGLFKDKDKIFAHFWEKYKLDSLKGGWDYIEPVLFGYVSAQIIESFYRYNLLQHETVLAQFHEWMTGSGILYLKEHTPAIGTSFTTHATILGRTLAGNHMPLYSKLSEYNPQQLANQFNISAKYSLEKISAQEADSFTTVSSITSKECQYLLEKTPDVVTPNGFEEKLVPEKDLYNQKKELAKNQLHKVTKAVLGYEVSRDTIFVLNSGRYEFKNKGIDVFINALSQLNEKNPQKEIVAIIAVPAGIKNINNQVLKRLKGEVTDDQQAYFCTHKLSEPQNDPVLNLIKERGFTNAKDSKVKIIFAPVYLNNHDGIFNLDYYDFLLGFDLTAFPSYYEPWGYTPMESLAFGIPTITTSLAGFGAWIKDKLDKQNTGAFVIDRTDTNDDEVVRKLCDIFEIYAQMDAKSLKKSGESAKKLSKLALWKNLFKNYVEAYKIAAEKGEKRHKEIGEYINYQYEDVKFEELDSKQPKWKKIFIKPNLPENINFLEVLAKNIWWTWQKDAIGLFEYVDTKLWETTKHNPVLLLEKLNMRQLQKLSKDEIFLAKLHQIENKFNAYMAAPKPKEKIAYFSMEFGLHDTIKIFSGGLGILAGDYMKEASDSNYNMVGIGLLYRYGYFKQEITLLGDQISSLSPQLFTHLPVIPIKNKNNDRLKIHLSLPGRQVYAQVWQLNIGRNKLYLLDTDIPENSVEDKKITSQLYGGDLEMRLKQEILLGIGGVRLLESLDIHPDLVHINEGHAAFTGIERLRLLMEKENLSYCIAKEVIRSSSLFTTHTPVPAGHDAFSEDMIRAFFAGYNEKLHLSWDSFMALGRVNPQDKTSKFSMSILAAKLSQEMNGVSKLHGTISQNMFEGLYPGYFPQESHITYVTNGVHLPFWVGNKWHEFYQKNIDKDYIKKQLDKSMWAKIYDVDSDKIWSIRNHYRKRLVTYLKERLKKEMIQRNESPRTIFKSIEGLREDILTIGFARRFATYKRALLIFNNPERLRAILNDPKHPTQIIFAGKAHPKDKAGQDLIKKVIEYSKSPEFIGKVFFVENYDINLAKYMVQGVDVWLNNPTRPLEASGTSGEKAIMNGVLNLSVLDGWWAEGYVPGAGWALKEERTYENQAFQDSLDALTIYDLLEDEIQEKFYQREHNIPEKWVEMIKKNIAEIVPNFTMRRMIEDYNRKFYQPQIDRVHTLTADNYKIANEITNWKKEVREKWDNITIINAEYPDSNVRPLVLGENMNVKLKLDLDGLSPEDIGVEILFGRKGQDDRLEKLLYVFNLKSEKLERNVSVYYREIPVTIAGVYDFTFRVYPKNKLLAHRMDFPMIKWI